MRKKPEPYSWYLTDLGAVPRFDFTSLTRRNPPESNTDCVLLQFPIGLMKNGCWIGI